MNSYFQLVTEPNRTLLKIYAPTEGGAFLSLQEVADWLDLKNVGYDMLELNRAIEHSAKGDQLVQLSLAAHMPERESHRIEVSPDKMTVTMRCYAPSEGAERMTTREILTDLVHRGIRFGIDTKVVDAFVASPQYCTDIVIAKGKEPVHGKDAYVEYLFSTDQHPHPTLNEDGSVDFFHMNILNLCAKGQKLAILHPADPGEPGTNVMGEVIKPREVRTVQLKHGNNIELSPDGKEMFAQVEGHVSLVDGRVFVKDILVFNEIGPATGNVDFEGDIEIKGNVATNFEVRAGGNVTINGVAEGAIIEAGGNVVITRGMNGMGRGSIKAGGDVIVKFLENATVQAGGYITSESILHSTVSAGTDITVTGRRGFISGGKATAVHQIKARNLGSEMANDTIIMVGVDPRTKRRIAELMKDQEQYTKQIQSIQPVVVAFAQKLQQGAKLTPDQVKNVQTLSANLKASQAALEEVKNELMELQGAGSGEETEVRSSVVVEGVVYPGTVIQISEVSMIVKSQLKYCRFVKERGDVKVASI